MKLQLFLALIVISTMAASVYGGCSISELTKCTPQGGTCKDLLEAFACFRRCDVDIPSHVDKALEDAGCGASALTNIGLPMMFLVVLAIFYNK